MTFTFNLIFMHFMRILLGFLALWCFLGQGNAQEVDYGSLKTGDSISAGYVLIVDTSYQTEQNIKVIHLLESSHPFAEVNKTIVYSEENLKVFDSHHTILYNWDVIVAQDETTGIRIFNKHWDLIGNINYSDYLQPNFYHGDIRIELLENELFALIFGDEMFLFNYSGTLVLTHQNIYEGEDQIEYFDLYKINTYELLAYYSSYMHNHKIFIINIDTKNIKLGPNVHRISDEYELGKPSSIFFSKSTRFLYIDATNKWCITDLKESFYSVPSDKLGYPFSLYNPILLTGNNRILVYSPPNHIDEFYLYNLNNGKFDDKININNFFSNFIHDKITRIEYIQERQNYYFIAVKTKDSITNQEKKVLLKFPSDSLTKVNYQKLENAEVLEFKSKEDLNKYYITKKIKY